MLVIGCCIKAILCYLYCVCVCVWCRAAEHNVPVQNSAPFYSSSDMGSSASRPKKKRAGRPRRADGRDYDTDYASSGDELDDHDFSRLE